MGAILTFHGGINKMTQNYTNIKYILYHINRKIIYAPYMFYVLYFIC